MRTRWYLAPLPLLIACGHGHSNSAESLYRQSEALWRRGAILKAIETADQGRRRWNNEPAAEWHWKFRLLEVEILLDQGSSRRALELLGPGADSPASGPLKVRYLASLAHARRDRRLLDQAFELASGQGHTSLLPGLELRRANLDDFGKRSGAYLRHALILARAASDDYVEARALLDLGFQHLNQSRFDEAIPWLEQAESKAGHIGADRVRERALGNLGWCYYRLGDFDRSLQSLSSAVELARRVGDEYLYRWLNDIGNIHYRRRDYAQAITYYQASADLAKKVQDEAWLTLTLNNLAATSLETGDLASAEQFNSQARELALKAHVQQSVLHSQLHTAWIEAARKQPQAESSFRSVIASANRHEPLVLWEAQAGLARFLRALGRDTEADRQYRDALATIEQEWSKLGEDRHKVTFLAQLISFYADYVDFLASSGKVERAAAVADSSRARVLAEKLGRAPDAGRLTILPRNTGQIILSYWLAPARSYLWVTGPQGVSQFTLPGAAHIADLVEKYRAAIEKGDDPLERDNPAGRTLYQILLAPARALTKAGASLIVIPDGCLHGLNFETLLVDGPSRRYWIEDVTVAVAPAAGLLRPAAARRIAPGRLLFLGDPVQADAAFPPLPHLRREVEIVQRSFPGAALTLLTREAANPQAYGAAKPGDYGLIHFAAHAVANAESPLNSAVILSRHGEEYKLYAKDVLEKRLQADLVTISACRGAGVKSYEGEGLLGFTWAFLQAGAKNVVAGLWDADDAATAEIMAEYYQRLVSGASPGEALRLAKLRLLRANGPNRRPYYWGTLQLFTREHSPRGRRREGQLTTSILAP